jgi:hypothetical protein
MKSKFFNPLTAGLIAAGLLTIAPIAVAQSTTLQMPTAEVEHLTCVRDAQGLMCKPESRDNAPANLVNAPATATEYLPQLVSPQQLGQFSDALLVCLYLVFPAGLGLAILLHDKRSELLSARIEQLEKLWNQPN